MTALDLGEDYLRETLRSDGDGLPEEPLGQAAKLRKYLPGSATAWHLEWRVVWTEWVTHDDFIRGPAAVKRLKAMRDGESGVRRDMLTLALFRGYLRRFHAKNARAELESLPAGLAGRIVLEFQLAELERKQLLQETQK